MATTMAMAWFVVNLAVGAIVAAPLALGFFLVLVRGWSCLRSERVTLSKDENSSRASKAWGGGGLPKQLARFEVARDDGAFIVGKVPEADALWILTGEPPKSDRVHGNGSCNGGIRDPVIVTVALLECTEEMMVSSVQKAFVDAIRACPEKLSRLTQRVVRVGGVRGVNTILAFESDAKFDIADHVVEASDSVRHVYDKAMARGMSLDNAVQQAVAALTEGPGLDEWKPLWQITVLGPALLIRLHHTMADGYGGLDMLSALAGSGISEGSNSSVKNPTGRKEMSRSLTFFSKLADLAWKFQVLILAPWVGLSAMTWSADTSPYSLHTAMIRRQQKQHIENSHTDRARGTKTQRCGERERATDFGTFLSWTPFYDLKSVKDIGHGGGKGHENVRGTLNDVLLSAIAGAVRKDMLGRCGCCETAIGDYNVVVPVSTRTTSSDSKYNKSDINKADEAVNAIALVPGFNLLAASESSVAKRLVKTVAATRAMKHSKTVAAWSMLASALANTTEPAVVRFATKKAGASCLAMFSNVRGPTKPLVIPGVGSVRHLSFVPPAGSSVGLLISAFSYCDRISVNVAVCAEDAVSVKGSFQEATATALAQAIDHELTLSGAVVKPPPMSATATATVTARATDDEDMRRSCEEEESSSAASISSATMAAAERSDSD